MENLIYKKITEIMKEIEPIAKNRVNTEQRYKFRGIDDLVDELSPILSRHGVFPVTQAITDISNEPVVSKNGAKGYRQLKRYTFRFCAEDGSFIDTIADGEAIDYGDKGSNKAYSVAYREAFFKMFVVPFTGSEDTEEVSHDLVNNSVPTQKTQVNDPQFMPEFATPKQQFDGKVASPKQVGFIDKLIFQKAANERQIFERYSINNIAELSMLQAKEVIEKLLTMQDQEHANNE